MFALFIGFIVMQRLLELIIAKRNENWLKKAGGIETGQSHYRYMVIIHILFFVTYIGEVLLFQKSISPWWPLLLALFLLTQFGRAWVIFTLGKYWNTKIITLPHTNVVKKGPYRFIKHPNYFIVSLEFLIIPFMFQAYMTALIFTFLNIWILSIRIPLEEKALTAQTDYGGAFTGRRRFLPIISKRI